MPPPRPRSSLAIRVGLLLLCVTPVAGAQAPAGGGGAGGLQVECPPQAQGGDGACRAGVAIYVGWRVYLAHCASCHAEDALGSEFAPSLVHRLRRFDRAEFFAALDRGYLDASSAIGPWGDIPDVARYYDELWTYLSGRAAGTVPPAALEPARRSGSPSMEPPAGSVR